MPKNGIPVVPHGNGKAMTNESAGLPGRDVTRTQQEVTELAREQAKPEKVEVVIHRKTGEIRDSNNYGNGSQSAERWQALDRVNFDGETVRILHIPWQHSAVDVPRNMSNPL